MCPSIDGDLDEALLQDLLRTLHETPLPRQAWYPGDTLALTQHMTMRYRHCLALYRRGLVEATYDEHGRPVWKLREPLL